MSLPEFVEEKTPIEINMDMHQIRFLARQITDREQFETMLATIDSGPMRAAVRKLLVPLVKFKL